MFNLDNIHPFYTSIDPESLSVDFNVTVNSISVVVANNKQNKVIEERCFDRIGHKRSGDFVRQVCVFSDDYHQNHVFGCESALDFPVSTLFERFLR